MMPIRDLQSATYFVNDENTGKIRYCDPNTEDAFESTLMELSDDKQQRLQVPLVTFKHL